MDSTEFQDGVSPAAGVDPMSLGNPWVLFTVIALIVLILFLGWHFGDRHGAEQERRRRDKHIDHLWKEINEKARTAAAAPRHQVIAAAQELLNQINKHIGPVVVVGALGASVNDLAHALNGEPVHDHGHGHGHGDHGKGHDDHGSGHGHGEPAVEAEAARPGIHINIGDISHGGKPDKAHGAGHGGGHGIDINAVRKAVSAFHDYWDRAETKGELRAAQRALMG